MTKWAHADVLDKGPTEIKATANALHLVTGYAAGQSYATVVAASLLSVAMASGDFVLSGAGARTLTTATKAAVIAGGSSAGGAVRHFAFVDSSTSRVLWVAPETSGIAVVAGSPYDLPSLTYSSQQPI